MESVFLHETVADVLPKKRTIVHFFVSDTLEEALRILSLHQILSAPVLDENNVVRGILDMHAVTLFVHGLYPKSLQSLDELDSKQLDEIGYAGVQFDNTQVIEVLQAMEAYYDNQDLHHHVTMATPIQEVLSIFHLGVHRCLVMGDEGHTLLSMISQSDLIRAFANVLCLVPENVRSRTLKEMDFFRGQKLQVVREDDVVLKAVGTLATRNLSALPVVDANGRLIAHFGSSLLRGLTKWNFGELTMTMKEYLGMTTGSATDSFMVRMQRRKAMHPVMCLESDTFEQTVCRVVAHGVHRLWMVDADQRPVAAVSIGDLFQPFCNWSIAEAPLSECKRRYWLRKILSLLPECIADIKKTQ